jgi:DNA-binding CsgD family transcriptional regulator
MKINDLLVFIVLVLVIIFNASDLIHDLQTNVSIKHFIQESIMIALSLGLIAVLIINIKKQKLDLQQLQQELNNAEQSLAHSDQRMQLARHEYSKLIQNQFETWQLSQSEQEIAFLLLKGLSFIEIAAIRQTKEKTVRQQASEIYRKSGVNGRHAFSAWFFEDFLN